MLYLGWIVAAFLAGSLSTAFLIARRKTLRDRIDGMGMLIGRAYAQVAVEIGRSPQITIREANGQTLRAWEEGHYFVSLLFDQNDVCLGVMEERG